MIGVMIRSAGQSELSKSQLLLVPLALWVLLAGVTGLIWHQQVQIQRKILGDKLRMAQAQLAGRCEQVLAAETRPLRRLSRWMGAAPLSEWEFDREADSLRNELYSFELIAWVDEAGKWRQVSQVARPARNPEGEQAQWTQLLDKAQQFPFHPAAAGVMNEGGQPLLLAAVPIVGVNEKGRFYRGSVVARISMWRLADQLIDPSARRRFQTMLLQNGRPLLGTEGDLASPPLEASDAPVKVLDQSWQLRLWPRRQFIADNRPQVVLWLLIGGLGASTLAAASLFQALHYRQREQRQTRRHLEALESLNGLAAGIAARGGSGWEVLLELVNASGQTLNLPIRMVGVVDQQKQTIRILMSQGTRLPASTEPIPLDHLPNIRKSLQSGQVVAVTQITRNGTPASIHHANRMGIVSAMIIPIRAQDGDSGVLLFGSPTARRFTDADIAMARLWGSQASLGQTHWQLQRRMTEALERQKQLLEQREAVFAVNAEIVQAHTLEQTLGRIVDLAPAALGVDLCAVALLTQRDDEMYIAAASMELAELFVGKRYADLSKTRGGQCVLSAQPIIIDDVAADPQVYGMWRDTVKVASMIYLPLLDSQRKVIGTLPLARRNQGGFSSEQVELMSLFADRAASAIENARLQHQTRVALEVQKSLESQREALFSLSMDLYHGPNPRDALSKLVQRVPDALGVDLCAICLVTQNPGIMRVEAATAPYQHTVDKQFNIADGNAKTVVEQRRAVIIERGTGDASINPLFRDLYQVGSIVYLPLIGSNESCFGMILLIRHSSGPFGEDQMELGQAFAHRAAAAIESAHLHQQALHDAQTKAMLLRELNHRVKNSLAGIVGLLSAQPPAMNPAASAWLNRVIDRVGLMARAHDLFAGGVGRVSLQDLLGHVIHSLAVIKPANVNIVQTIECPEVRLETEQAVHLGMVLQELCYNALTHGTAPQGSITVRISRLEPDGMRVEVMDQGPGPVCQISAHESTGMGLKIVQGLVGRELRGRFALSARTSGGTLAVVEFPLTSKDLKEGEPYEPGQNRRDAAEPLGPSAGDGG